MNFAVESGGKASESAGLKSICLKKMSQKRGVWTESTKKRLKRLEKDVIVKLIENYFGSLNYFRGYYECDPFAGLVLVIL